MPEEYIVPENLYYTKEHEWLKVQGDTAIMGITDYAQKSLHEIVFVDLPEVCLLYTSPSPRDRQKSRMPSSA